VPRITNFASGALEWRMSLSENRFPLFRDMRELTSGRTMRAEVQMTVDEIKQSVGLLRRHL